MSFKWTFCSFFKNKFHVGYSDHSVGELAIQSCVLLGARIFEKHFTLDKSDTTIRDHALSATPQEFFQMVQIVILLCIIF